MDCIIDAVRTLNFVTSSYIVQCAKGKAKTAYGFIWKYGND